MLCVVVEEDRLRLSLCPYASSEKNCERRRCNATHHPGAVDEEDDLFTVQRDGITKVRDLLGIHAVINNVIVQHVLQFQRVLQQVVQQVGGDLGEGLIGGGLQRK